MDATEGVVGNVLSGRTGPGKQGVAIQGPPVEHGRLVQLGLCTLSLIVVVSRALITYALEESLALATGTAPGPTKIVEDCSNPTASITLTRFPFQPGQLAINCT